MEKYNESIHRTYTILEHSWNNKDYAKFLTHDDEFWNKYVIQNEERWNKYCEVMSYRNEKLNEAGISIPLKRYPQIDLSKSTDELKLQINDFIRIMRIELDRVSIYVSSVIDNQFEDTEKAEKSLTITRG